MIYEKPKIKILSDLSEGVYLASGDNGVKCDSTYMKGIWQKPDYSNWNGIPRGYKQQFGCLGCPANTNNGCGLLTHYIESGNAASYDIDNGKRKPTWEKKGYTPDEVVSDWAM